PLAQMPYQPAGDLMLGFPNSSAVENYRRDLNLDTAVASVEYTDQGTRFTRQVFASPVDQVIVVRLAADKTNSISFSAGFKSPQKIRTQTETGNTLVIRGVNGSSQGISGALKFQVRIKAITDGGTLTVTSNALSVTNANAVTLLIAAATSYRDY